MSEVDIPATTAALAAFRAETSAACRADHRVLVGNKTIRCLTKIIEALAVETGKPLALPPQDTLLTLDDLHPYLGPAETALATLPRLRAHRRFLDRLRDAG